jgi:hypothetical protein
MSNPPRRSRPKKPATTIDLEATPVAAVGYPGPTSVDSPEEVGSQAGSDTGRVFDDPETTLTAQGTSVDGTEAASGDGPAAAETSKAVPATAQEEFAAEESLQGPTGHRDIDVDETILSAAEPDFIRDESAATSGPPQPMHDYSTPASSHHDPRGGGMGSAFGSALLGAVLALAGAGALQYAGVLPSVGLAPVDENAPQYARAGDVQQVTSDLGTLRGEVEQLRSVQAAGGTGPGASQADLTALGDRVASLEQREAPAAAPSADPAAVDAVRGAAEAAQRAAEEATRTGSEARTAADEARAAADQAGQAAGQSQSTAETARQAAETARQTGETAQQAASTAQQTAAAAQTSIAATNEAIAALKEQLTAIETANQKAGAAIAAAGLKAAIDRGGPFMGELEAFATATGDDTAVGALRDFAAQGVPTAPQLAAAWPEVETRIMAALNPVDPNASVGDQILSGLSGLVTTRPVGAAPAGATGPNAAISRLTADVEGGDFSAFLAEWEQLPQPAKDVSQDFQARVAARVKAEEVVGETLTNAVKAVGQPAGTAG